MITRFRPLDTREGQVEVLTAIVVEALRVFTGCPVDDPDADDGPWAIAERAGNTAALDTALVALAAVLEVRKAFPVRAVRKPKPKPVVAVEETIEIEVELIKPRKRKVK